MNLWRFFKGFFAPSQPLSEDVLGRGARNLTFRVVKEADIPPCVSFYRANESAHFPPDVCDRYEGRLRRGDLLTLLATQTDRPVGCCSISTTILPDNTQFYCLCYGLVAPAYQRQGIGTAQLLVRLGLIRSLDHVITLIMYAVPNSVPFYKRFGFEFKSREPADDGNLYWFGLLRARKALIEKCRAVLADCNITYPSVPIRENSRRDSEPVASV